MLIANIFITGIVQGVGFRPFIYRMAKQCNIYGTVCNTGFGVLIKTSNDSASVDNFIKNIKNNLPPLAVIENIAVDFIEEDIPEYEDFTIIHTQAQNKTNASFINIPPDISICKDCINELNTKSDYRYQYEFINCTNCGPRFTIITKLPYDRASTTMKVFKMCRHCHNDYTNPANRRFHAEPIACRKCGPKSDVQLAIDSIKSGKIISLKGLGGYHLICDAFNNDAVNELKNRKNRKDKPLAVMFDCIDTCKKYCIVSELEEKILTSRESPIVLLNKKNMNDFQYVAPNSKTLGVMLPYTPLHYMIMKNNFKCIVCTSANISGESITYKDNNELYKISDVVIPHNREINMFADDSVCRIVNNKMSIIRRARGFVPNALFVKDTVSDILSLGAELKNTFCITSANNYIVSQYIGDIKNVKVFDALKTVIDHFKHLYNCNFKYIACDLHPNFITTRYVEELSKINNLKLFRIQHHYAHMCAAMIEHNIQERALGVIFDGTGYGTDGNIWGGEFLMGDYTGFSRFAHIDYFKLPGGDICTKEIWRLKINQDNEIINKMMEKNINSPLTSSVGRLFDKVASTIGLRNNTTYEGQAAIELEQIIEQTSQYYDYSIINGIVKIDFEQIVKDASAIGVKSCKFHNTLINIIIDVVKSSGIKKVVLAGGCFMNKYLLENTYKQLQKIGVNVYTNELYPVNDSSISLGQAAIVSHLVNNMKDNE